MKSEIVWAEEKDVPLLLEFIRDLAKYEKLESEVTATPDSLKQTLFGPKKFAEALFIKENGVNIGFALFFHNYSTFLGKPGLYLEDLFVKPAFRGRGYGKQLLTFLAKLAIERGCGRLEWWVLNWNKPALEFYASLGAQSMQEWTVQRLTGKALLELAQSPK